MAVTEALRQLDSVHSCCEAVEKRACKLAGAIETKKHVGSNFGSTNGCGSGGSNQGRTSSQTSMSDVIAAYEALRTNK